VFVKLAARPKLLKGVRDERGFLLCVAHNLAVSSMRRREVRERSHERYGAEAESIFTPAADEGEQSFRDAVAAGMAELPAEQRAVLHLKIWQGLTFDTIATALGIPANTAASRYRYALDKLRHHLRPLYDELK
jgi:RNA polymerase sigma-70 factor (ECF subfamily)